MLGYSLWLIIFFQIAFIYAASDENEYVHIKVHLSDLARKTQQSLNRLVRQNHQQQHHHQRQKQQQYPIAQKFHYSTKRPLPATTLATHPQQHNNRSPYEFDIFGLGEPGIDSGNSKNAKDILPEQLMSGIPNGYGPVVFNNDIESSTVRSSSISLPEQPTLMTNKHLMHHLFTTPEMMMMPAALDTPHELNDDEQADTYPPPIVNTYTSSGRSSTGRSRDRPSSLHKNTDLLHEYFQHLNREQLQPQKQSTKITQKRKRYNHQNDAETIEQDSPPPIQQEVVEYQQKDFQPFYPAAAQYFQPQRQQQEEQQQRQRQHKRKQPIQQSPFHRHQNYNPLHWTFGDDGEEIDEVEDHDDDDDGYGLGGGGGGGDDASDEFDTAEDVSSSASNSNEDITSAFNKFQPISYQDTYDTYAMAPPSISTTNYVASQPSLSSYQQTTEPTYSSTGTSNWRQYYNQPQYLHHRPQVQQQQIQQENHQQHRYKQHQQTKHPKQKRAKSKSQQTQYLLPSTTLRLTTTTSSSSSSLPSSSSLSSSSPTSPINSGFTGGSITSTRTLPWTLPYDFVQQSQQEQHQQQNYQQQQQHRQHEQQLEAQQYQHKQPKLPYHKKRKNRNRRKRNRIIVQ